MAAGLAAEAVDLAQAEAGALADVLGGEERIERARARLRVHADAGIHRPRSITYSPGSTRSANEATSAAVERAVGGLDDQPAAVAASRPAR